MAQSLCFNDFTFSPIPRDNQPWFRSSELARALGYKREDQIAKIYRNNADEFTQDMTQLIEILDNAESAFPVKVRIFSLRGCHLLAMFARTPVAKAFRRWVLDVIEQYGDRVPAEQSVTLSTPSTPADRKQLEVKALPAAPRFDEAAMLELAAEIREAQQNYSRTFGRLCSRLITMSIPIFTALESRVYKQAPDRPFHGTRVGAQWDRYFTERMIAALHSFDDRLPDEKNPAILLLEYARAMSAR